MDTKLLTQKFARIGARLKVGDGGGPRRFNGNGSVALDIGNDARGEYFDIVPPADDAVSIEVLDVRPDDRHLLLLVREGKEKGKFLCGHDERHWFVAAIPESAPVGTVRQAKEALKPTEVRSAQAREEVSGKARERRKNSAYVRQGEWFFLPAPQLVVDPKLILRDEPLVRGRGKPHRMEFCYREGGHTVYVCSRHPNGLTPENYRRLIADNQAARGWSWRVMQRDAGIYVRGRVRHADHKTVMLHGWHRVVMNTETQARAMRNVAFLD